MNCEAGESQANLFGDNSNWRGPIWLSINCLWIRGTQMFHHYYGDEFQVGCPTGSGKFVSLDEVANEFSNRMIKIWLRDAKGERPCTRRLGDSLGGEGDRERYLFQEYFPGDGGRVWERAIRLAGPG